MITAKQAQEQLDIVFANYKGLALYTLAEELINELRIQEDNVERLERDLERLENRRNERDEL